MLVVTLLFIAALVCFILAIFPKVQAALYPNLMALGWAFIVIAWLVLRLFPAYK